LLYCVLIPCRSRKAKNIIWKYCDWIRKFSSFYSPKPFVPCVRCLLCCSSRHFHTRPPTMYSVTPFFVVKQHFLVKTRPNGEIQTCTRLARFWTGVLLSNASIMDALETKGVFESFGSRVIISPNSGAASCSTLNNSTDCSWPCLPSTTLKSTSLISGSHR